MATSSLSIPDWIDPVDWADYEAMRKKIRKPMTGRARQLAIKTLERLRELGHPPSVVLQQSILNSWQGLFEPKAGPAAKAPASPRKPTLEQVREAERVSAINRAKVAEINRDKADRERQAREEGKRDDS